MLVLLKLNNFHIDFTQKELADLTYRIAQNIDSYSDVCSWIECHLQ